MDSLDVYGNREPNYEPGAPANLAVHTNSPTLCLDQPLGDSETQARPTSRPGARWVHSVKPVEYQRKLVLCYPGPCVFDHYAHKF